ncbi:Protein kinase superfamily protein [Striga hermonthica]|uniref:Protein kinase superfamily protein n=1 Tax=Striga hermonthica TaxID=68872 RepID=A0A9N7NWS5_STRHE|nr:Protein kinase superfamily protein [Striga hermonthica]
MSRRQTSGRGEHVVKSDVVVAVKVCKDIPRAALTWALTNVVRPGGCIRLLVLIPPHHSSLWHLAHFHFHFHNECTAGQWRLMSGTISEQNEYITEQCNQMLSQLHDIYDPEKVMVKVKVVFDSTQEAVASEAKRAQAHWVVLDKHMTKEAHVCTQQLNCNIVVVKHSEPKVLQLSLIETNKNHSPNELDSSNVPNASPTASTDRTTSLSSLDTFNLQPSYSSRESEFDQTDSDYSGSQIPSSRSTSISYSSPDSRNNLRQIMSLRIKSGPHDPPPLCSICHNKSPVFGNPPRIFSYHELERATAGVGCIVHRDLRPNNILLTHDFEPLVGDFGLARLQADGDAFEKTRVMGTFGYMAPEYAQTGQLCEKADVYSFGVILVELVTGRKAVDISRPKGEQCLTEWARPLLEENALSEHVDPCLMGCYSEREVHNMMHCALLCLQRDPESRPRMSQVLRMLEGD